MTIKCDTLYRNGRVFTSDSENLHAEAFAVTGKDILWVGKNAEIEDLGFECGNIIDLEGRTVIPGLIDSHEHAIMLANCNKEISALPPKVNSIEELIQAISKEASEMTDFGWIKGWGYDEGKFAEHRAPNRYDLDKGTSDYPVQIQRTCAHICAVNSKALEMAGITKDTPDPEGGKIGRFPDGEPDGILYENARNLVNPLVPPLSAEQLSDNVCDLGKLLVSQGITATADMGELQYDLRFSKVYDDACRKGFPVKIGCYYMWDALKNDTSIYDKEAELMAENEQIRLCGVKLIGDGSISGKTAWCDVPYKDDPENFGIAVCTEEEIEDAMNFAESRKCQVSVHCMGLRAIDRAVDHAYARNPWMADSEVPTFRFEHITMPSASAISKVAEKGMYFVTQPIFIYAEIESYLTNLGIERTQEAYPIQDWKDAGVKFALSTDAPATAWAVPSDPFINLKAAVTRKAWEGTDCNIRHALSIEEALIHYTKDSAIVLGFTDAGMIKKDYKADFVILDSDILNVPAEEIDKVKPIATFINGEKVYG